MELGKRLAEVRGVLVAEAMKITKDRSSAEDLAHDTIVKALRSDSFDGRHLISWLFTIMRSVWLDHLKKYSTIYELTGQELSDVPVIPDQVRYLEVDHYQRALSALSPEHREILLLYAVGDHSEEVIRILGVPKGTAKSRRNRARAAMKEALEDLMK